MIFSFPDCQPLFEKYSIGCLYFSVSDFDDYEDAFNHCAAVGGALYEPRNLNELAELLQNVTLNFPSCKYSTCRYIYETFNP